MADSDEQMLEAAETLILCSLSPAISDLWRINRPKPEANLKMIPSLFLPTWGLRLRRSRCSCILKTDQEYRSSFPAAATRTSPATPLDFCSSYLPSTSGSDEAASLPARPATKRRRAGEFSVSFCDVEQKVSAGQSPSVGMTICSSKPIRLQGKKKTIAELHEQERLLADENTMLRNRVESKRKELEALITENRRLHQKSSLQQHSRDADEAAKPHFTLPDLNEPAVET